MFTVINEGLEKLQHRATTYKSPLHRMHDASNGLLVVKSTLNWEWISPNFVEKSGFIDPGVGWNDSVALQFFLPKHVDFSASTTLRLFA